MRKIITISLVIFSLAIITISTICFIAESYSVIFSNELAVDQLNGGNDAYVALQTFNNYKNLALATGYAVTIISVTLIIIIVLKALKERKK